MAVPVVLVLAILMISLGGLALSTSYNNIISSGQAATAARAFLFAEAGARDILGLLAVNRDYCGLAQASCTTSTSLAYGINFKTGASGSSVCASTSDFTDGCALVRLEAEPNDASTVAISSMRIATITGHLKDAVRKLEYDVLFSSSGKILNINQAEVQNQPTAATAGATGVTTNGANLNLFTNPNGKTVTAWFRYGTSNPTVCNDTDFGKSTNPPTSGNLTGTNPTSYSVGISSLNAGTVYYYCAIVQDTVTLTKYYGDVLSMQTN